MAKFLALPRSDQWLLVKALAVLVAVKLRLALLPFRPGCSAQRRPVPRHGGPSPERIAWAIERAGRCCGSATCLARALAAQGMLRRHGFSSRVSIGVVTGERPPRGSNLIAHAWLESGGEILVGGPDIGRYTPLLTWSN